MAAGASRSEPRTPFAWVLWWRVDAKAVEKQARQYRKLPFYETSRGQGALLLLLSAAISTAMILLASHNLYGLADVVLFLALAVFVYLGHRWAIIGAMVLWTLEKLIQLIAVLYVHNYVMPFTTVLWWTIYMHVFYTALRVEQHRRDKPEIAVAAFD